MSDRDELAGRFGLLRYAVASQVHQGYEPCRSSLEGASGGRTEDTHIAALQRSHRRPDGLPQHAVGLVLCRNEKPGCLLLACAFWRRNGTYLRPCVSQL